MKICILLLVVATAFASGQRITTIQLDGVQYFISRMNPYSPELNYFLAYQYCRSLGLQLASFETKEKADTMTQYLKNAGYKEYDFWTSGNKLGTDLYLWMSTGLPFNSTFDYMFRRSGNRAADVPPGTEPQRVARESDSGSSNACVAMMAPTLAWDAHDCLHVKDFICEQTRCYYYNYGSIPVSATQGNRRPYLTTTGSPTNDIDEQTETDQTNKEITSENAATAAESGTAEVESASAGEEETSVDEAVSDDNDLIDDETGAGTSTNDNNDGISADPVVGRLIAGAAVESGAEKPIVDVGTSEDNEENGGETMIEAAESTRPDNIPDITSLFADGPIPKSRKETAFDGLVTHEVRSSSRSSNSRGKLEHRGDIDDHDDREAEETGVSGAATDSTDSAIEESHTIGPYDSVQDDYVNDHSVVPSTRSKRGSPVSGHSEKMKIDKEQDEDTSTYLPVAEPDYRYNIKWRSMGKVLEPPSK